VNNIERLTETVDELRDNVRRWEERINNIEFALGIAPAGSRPLDSEAIDEMKSRLLAIESALGIE